MSNVINDIKSAPETFTSWDKCMSKAYCKWPVIAGIVIGSLIILSVLFCLVQCLCCGYSCAKMLCCCCNGCDCGGKDRRRNKDDRPSKYQDSSYHQLHQPNPYSGYQPPAAMAPAYGAPQTARFESDTKGGDALPAMPSWDNAVSHRVEVHDPQPKPEDVEMGRLNPHSARNGYDQVPLSPTSPTHAIPGYFPPGVIAGGAAAGATGYGSSSDLGNQRLNQQHTGYRGVEYDQPTVPTSPAPTYQTHAHQPSGDRFIAGAASPSPYGYQTQQQTQHGNGSPYNHESPYQDDYNNRSFSPPAPTPRSNTFSPPPAGTMPTSNSYNSFNSTPSQYATPYEAPQQHSYGYSNNVTSPTYHEAEASGARPPSLLQVGRKAVPGSTREV
jgi:hypothetical protein